MLRRQDLLDELDRQIQAGATGFYIQSAEEGRLDGLLVELCEMRALKPMEWNRAYGLCRFDTKRPLREEGDRAYELGQALERLLDEELDGRLVIIRHARLALEGNDVAVARLKLLLSRVTRHHAGRSAVVLIAERLNVPSELEAQLMVYGLALPRGEEVAALVKDRYAAASDDLLKRLTVACGGLSQEEIVHALSLASPLAAGVLDDSALDIVLQLKEQGIAKSGVLEMVRADVTAHSVGGLRNLKDWLERRAKVMVNLAEATAFGVQAPKGVLIAGMPGCGKSLTAKITASMFGLPLLRLDIGSLLGKYVGESEHNMRRALHTAEAISPCVLWIDELEKAFVGMGGANASEVTSRLLGYFLTWMQEKSGAVFTIATANDITALPPELLRKGRFDEIFYVGFPDSDERREIIEIHLKRRHQDPTAFNMEGLIALSRGYTGADIENAINEAMEVAFVEGGVLSQKQIDAAIEQTTPLRETMQKKVREYEEAFDKLKLKPASRYDGLSVAEMIRLADAKNPLRRLEVAHSREVPEDLMLKLAEDSDLEVRKAIYTHVRCPESLLSEQISRAEGESKDDDIFPLACVHGKAPIDLLVRITKSSKVPDDVLWKILRVTAEPERILQAASLDDWRPSGSLASRVFTSSRGKRPPTPAMEALARNPHVTSSLQRFLSSNEVPVEVRKNLARNYGLSTSTQHTLAEDADETVRQSLAGARIPEEIQRKMASDASEAVRFELAGNWSLTHDIQIILAGDVSLKVRQELAAGDHEAALLALVDDENEAVFGALLGRSDIPDAVCEKILSSRAARKLKLIKSRAGDYRTFSDAILDKMIQHPDHAVRQAVCECLSESLNDVQRCRLLYDATLSEAVRLGMVDAYMSSEQIMLALLDSESPALREFGCCMFETNPRLGDSFFIALAGLSTWRRGLVQRQLLADFAIEDIRLQTLLAIDTDVEIRKGIAQRDLEDGVKVLLAEDSEQEVQDILAEGASVEIGWHLMQKSLERTRSAITRVIGHGS
nr:AAA family ATPase [uncultured Cupriavidus sp.]